MGELVPSRTLILVLIVREAGLRSTLAARLSMAGADVITADSLDDPRMQRLRAGAVLVLDAPAAEDAGGPAAVLADPRWETLVLIGDGETNGATDPRLLRVGRAIAGVVIEARLPEWRNRRS